jgi:hypothetical protein
MKVIVSYSEFSVYFFMLLATMVKGGYLYLVYPFMIFGYCMLEEQRPGRLFWYFVIFYTQFLIILSFAMQLDLWSVVLSEETLKNVQDFY